MDEQHEREQVQEKCLRLSKCAADVRAVPMPSIGIKHLIESKMTLKKEIYLQRRATQMIQNYVLVQFVNSILEKALDLMEKSEETREIGEEMLDGIHDFLDHYLDLFEQEYEYCQMTDGKSGPLE